MDTNRLEMNFLIIRFIILSFLALMNCVLATPIVHADTLVTSERRITSSTAYETTPTIGNDGTTDLVVYTLRPVLGGGLLGPGDIWYQPLVGGAPNGAPVQVTSGDSDDELNDVSGDYIIYTAYDSTTATSGSIIVYQISTGNVYTLGTATIIQEPKIHGDRVVWREGGALSAKVMYYELGWVPYGTSPRCLAGPVPPTYDVQIGDRFAVWAELNSSNDYDVHAYDFAMMAEIRVADTAAKERQPATSGAWIVWEQQDGAVSSIEALNMDTTERVSIANGGGNFNPTVDGDLIAWETDVAGNLDIWVHRFSVDENYAVTTDSADQYLNDVFGDLVAYVDMTSGSEDIYVSTLAFVPDNQPPEANAGGDDSASLGILYTLDGSASTDPEENYPLTYAWTLTAKPEGSVASLSGADTVNPYFTPDLFGDYHVELVVTDSLGAVSTPDEVIISTNNTPPVADAGPDQAIILIGTLVELDGTHSYDLDGDPITYQWTLQVPNGSLADLNNATSEKPSFIADVNGDYRATLVVNDGSVDSVADEVLISFNNVNPVADAGGNQAVYVGETVTLDGSGSIDDNGDPLTYQWSFASRPADSTTMINNATNELADFYVDEEGTYVVSLVVNDGLEDSVPSNVTITASSSQQQVIDAVHYAIDAINGLPPDAFKNRNMQNTLTNKLNAVLAQINEGEYQQALDKLLHDVLSKTNGCADAGAPDKNDWITTCADQAQVYPVIMETIGLLQELVGG